MLVPTIPSASKSKLLLPNMRLQYQSYISSFKLDVKRSMFNKVKNIYEKSLADNGFDYKVKYEENTQNLNDKKRSRNFGGYIGSIHLSTLMSNQILVKYS